MHVLSESTIGIPFCSSQEYDSVPNRQATARASYDTKQVRRTVADFDHGWPIGISDFMVMTPKNRLKLCILKIVKSDFSCVPVGQ